MPTLGRRWRRSVCEVRGDGFACIRRVPDVPDAASWSRLMVAPTTGLKDYITRLGRPAALYSDRHGLFTKQDPEEGEPTQFQRTLSALEIAGIQALTPQATGRIERLFQTLQDRLVKALRLAGISEIGTANVFLED